MSALLRLPTREECVVRELLIRYAAEQGDADLMLFENGERWTAAETLERVRVHAAGLAALGVGHGSY
ncbi:MAG: ATP-dependent acyl-CoA ligase, partial [Gammaproteobacteria bacterium]|nr:ATP-dependent acyl-CoA ligase [Gammaproteobacteria bacterium]